VRLNDEERDIVLAEYDRQISTMPKTVQKKRRIRNLMYVKFFLENELGCDMCFERFIVMFEVARRYRGE
jgi:hypothetical protein